MNNRTHLEAFVKTEIERFHFLENVKVRAVHLTIDQLQMWHLSSPSTLKSKKELIGVAVMIWQVICAITYVNAVELRLKIETEGFCPR